MRTRRLASIFFAAALLAACAEEDDGGGVRLLRNPPATDAGTAKSDAAGSTTDSGASNGPSDQAPQGEDESGEATYYDADGVGACGSPTSDGDLVAAMNGAQYSKAVCGKCAAVTGPRGSVVVKIVDKCPGCSSGDLDLSQTAFAKIAKMSEGRVKITWHFVTCP
jgi:expansin